MSVPEETRAMATLHGRVQRWFWREPALPQRQKQVLAEYRRGWLSGHGLPLRTTGASAYVRKQHETIWKDLASAGLVTIRATSGRRTHIRFTERGQVLIDQLTATGCRWVWWDAFAAFVAKCKEVDRCLLPESYVAEVEPWPMVPTPAVIDAIKDLHIKLAPFITAGDVASCVDALGCHWLLLTEQGEATFKAGEPPEPPDGWELDEDVATIYEEAYAATAGEIEQAEPSSTNEVQISIGAGRGWGDFASAMAFEKELADKRAAEQEGPQA